MFKIGFKEHYRVLHINNEMGNRLVGGAGTYMNEIYKYHKSDTGFIYMNMGGHLDDFDMEEYRETGDVAIMHMDESSKLANLDWDILVVQFYEFANCINDMVMQDRKLVYVIHSVPTTEPMLAGDPFGGNEGVRQKFEYLCNRAHILVCVSNCSEDTLYLLADIHNFEARKSISDTIVNRTLGLIEYEDELTELLMKDQLGLDEKTEQILFRQYEKCNPENFEYYGYVSEVEDDYKKYIYSEDADVENVYFINEESMYSGDLDCINIMGPLLYTDENEKLPEAFNSPHIQEKVLYTIDRFDMIFWQQGYWSRWFE